MTMTTDEDSTVDIPYAPAMPQRPIMRQSDFYEIVATEDRCVTFLRERGLLPGGAGGSGFCKK